MRARRALGSLLGYFATTMAGGLLLVWAGARLGEWLRP